MFACVLYIIIEISENCRKDKGKTGHTINHSHARVEQHKNLLDIVQICWLFATVALEARRGASLA